MRRAVAILLAFFAFALLSAGNVQASPESALSGLKSSWKDHAPWFSNPRLTPLGHLKVTASPDYLSARTKEKRWAAQALAEDWAVRMTSEAGPLYLEIEWGYGGLLSEIRPSLRSGATRLFLVDRWDDTEFPWIAEAASRDRWFLFMGGQSTSGGDIGSSSGINLRVGTTLFRNKYDIAFLFNHTSTGPSPKLKANVYGAVGRVLFRKSNNWGYNLGGQIAALTASGAATDGQVSAVAGINYYQPSGTWDITLNIGDEGNRTFVIGYSIFLSQ